MADKSGSGSIGGVSFSYSTSGGKTTYNVGGKSYSSAKSAANAIKSSSGYDSSKGLVRGSSSSSGGNSSSSGGSSSSSSSSKSNSSYNFVDPSVLHDAQINGLSREQIDAKWGTGTSNSIDKYDQTYNKGGQTSWQYGASRKSGGSSSGGSSSGGSSSGDYITSMQFGQGTADDYQKNRNNTLGKYYSDLGKLDYNSIYNDLSRNSGFASSSENDKRATVNKIMEQAANAKGGTLTGKSDEEVAAEQWYNDEDDDILNDIFNGLSEEDYYDEVPNMDEQLYPDWRDDFNDRLDRVEQIYERDENTIKKTVPEERDTSYDYNTYYQENLAPDNNYENGESKNTLNEEPQVTLVSQYQEPVSTALNDLGLLTPNEAVTNETPNAEEPDLPKGYENGEDIVTDFENQLQTLGSEEGTGLTPQAVAQTYSDFKNQLVQYANNNNLSKEEYEALLAQLKNNEILQNVLVNKQ